MVCSSNLSSSRLYLIHSHKLLRDLGYTFVSSICCQEFLFGDAL